MKPVYKRVLLKLSGEVLAGDKGSGIDFDKVLDVCERVKTCAEMGVQVAIVVGGGNFIRGKTLEQIGMDRVQGDYMGMLATIINALAIQGSLESEGVDTRVQTSIDMPKIAEPFIQRRAIRHLEKGRVVIFGGGTGSPYFSTDTTAALRASEIKADVILMAKSGVDGVYDSDPGKNPDAKRYDHLTYEEVVEQNLQAVDMTSSVLARDNGMEMRIFALQAEKSIIRAASGDFIGTTITA